MAKMNKKILEIIKMKFQSKEFILKEGIIYKKIKARTIKIQKSDVPVILLINSVSRKKYLATHLWIKFTKDIEKSFKKSVANGEFIIIDDKLYRKYGCTHERGYIEFNISIDNIIYRTFAHRIIYYLYYDIWDDNKVINHLDGNKSNNNIENLELISQFDNVIYSLKKGEIILNPHFIDDITRKKYRLNDEQWEIFKKEAYNAYRKNVLENDRVDSSLYKVCKDSTTLEEYNKNLYILELKNSN